MTVCEWEQGVNMKYKSLEHIENNENWRSMIAFHPGTPTPENRKSSWGLSKEGT